jgi:DHA1 family multidrug resistance protein-like MFS transporter
MSSKDIVQMTLLRPLTMTFTEPIVLAIDLYIGLVYAILYSYFESFPIVYLEGYRFPTANSNLPFLALLVGSIISYIGYCLWNRYVHLHFPVPLHPSLILLHCHLLVLLVSLGDWADPRFYFEKKFNDAGGKIKPEARLPMSLIGAFLFPICLFWFAWTSNRTHWISPVIASSFFGIGITWM